MNLLLHLLIWSILPVDAWLDMHSSSFARLVLVLPVVLGLSVAFLLHLHMNLRNLLMNCRYCLINFHMHLSIWSILPADAWLDDSLAFAGFVLFEPVVAWLVLLEIL